MENLSQEGGSLQQLYHMLLLKCDQELRSNCGIDNAEATGDSDLSSSRGRVCRSQVGLG